MNKPESNGAKPAAPPPLRATAKEVEARLRRHGIRFTLGGEPTYVPLAPEGHEWSITALGPTKLRYAWALAEALTAESLPHALSIFSPGKHYPGETNPRWAINLLWHEDGTPIFPASPRLRPGHRENRPGALRVAARPAARERQMAARHGSPRPSAQRLGAAAGSRRRTLSSPRNGSSASASIS